MNVIPRLRLLSDWVDRLVVAACCVALVIMLTISLAGIVVEALLSLSARFGHEDLAADVGLGWLYANTRASVVRLFLPWLGMLSITVAFKRGEHIAIAALTRSLPPRALLAARVLNLAATALFGLAIAWYGIGFFAGAANLTIVSDTLQVSQRWMAASVPLAGLIICVHLADGLALVEPRDAAAFAPDSDGAAFDAVPRPAETPS